MGAGAAKARPRVFALVRDAEGHPVVDLEKLGGTYKNLPFEISKALTEEDIKYLQQLEEN